MGGYKIINHTADVGIEGYGETIEEAFCETARGMMGLITETGSIRQARKEKLAVEGNNYEELLNSWLAEILSRFTIGQFLTCDFSIKNLTSSNLSSELRGEDYDNSRHELKMEIKTVTYHQLAVEKSNDGWHTRVIFDV